MEITIQKGDNRVTVSREWSNGCVDLSYLRDMAVDLWEQQVLGMKYDKR